MVGHVLSSTRYSSQCNANEDKIHLPIFTGLVVATTCLDFMYLTLTTKRKQILAEGLLSRKVYNIVVGRTAAVGLCVRVVIYIRAPRLLAPIDIIKIEIVSQLWLLFLNCLAPKV